MLPLSIVATQTKTLTFSNSFFFYLFRVFLKTRQAPHSRQVFRDVPSLLSKQKLMLVNAVAKNIARNLPIGFVDVGSPLRNFM
jgi:hypothetical protein